MTDWLDDLVDIKQQEKQRYAEKVARDEQAVDDIWPVIVRLFNEACSFLENQGKPSRVVETRTDAMSRSINLEIEFTNHRAIPIGRPVICYTCSVE